jgi:hypothetical protein
VTVGSGGVLYGTLGNGAFSNRRMSLKIGTRFQYRMSLKRILVSNGQ